MLFVQVEFCFLAACGFMSAQTACAVSIAGFKQTGNSAHLPQSNTVQVRFRSGCLLIGRSLVKEQVTLNFNEILDP